jgi:hypothetical protein
VAKHTPRFFGAALITLALAGCAGTAAGGDPAIEQTHPVGDGYLCSDLPISREAVEERVPVSDIGEPGRTALAEAMWDDFRPLELPAEEDWYVATATTTLVGVLRDEPVEAIPASFENPPDHEMLTVRWVGNATNLDPGWYVDRSDRCALTVDLGDLTVPAVELQTAPDPASRHLQLNVFEESCNSGRNAEGRVEVVRVDETDDRVSLILGVRPPQGNQTCPSNPATPFTLTLAEPVGDREVVNASLADPRPLTVSSPPGLEGPPTGSDNAGPPPSSVPGTVAGDAGLGSRQPSRPDGDTLASHRWPSV